MSKSNGKFAIGAVFGAIAGAVAGLLVAPKSGKETREEIKNKSKELLQDANVTIDDAKERAADATKVVKSEASTLKKRVENAVDGAKKGFSKK
ncbi:MAG: YtxH domain-containing protein [Candidatus Saccharimonadales bacterium]